LDENEWLGFQKKLMGNFLKRAGDLNPSFPIFREKKKKHNHIVRNPIFNPNPRIATVLPNVL
jgi:hypothetical protein